MRDNSSLYGINQGEAQILPGNAVIPMIRQQQAQEQQKKEAQAQAVASQIQKINFDKTRQADLPDLMNGYNSIKDMYKQSLATQDPNERVALQNKMAQAQMMLQQHINNSQEALAHERTIGNLSLNPNAHLKDDFGDYYNKLTSTPLSSGDYQKHSAYFNSPFDTPNYDLNGATKGIIASSLTPSDNGYTTGTLPGGIKQVYKNVGSDLDKGKMMQSTLDKMNTDKDFRKAVLKGYAGTTSTPATITPDTLNTLYGNQPWAQGLTKPGVIPNHDPVAAAHNYVQTHYNMHKDDLTASPEAVATQWPQRVAPMSAYEQYKIAHGLGDAANTDDGRDKFISALQSGDSKAREQVVRGITDIGGQVIPDKNGFTVSVPQKSKQPVLDKDGKQMLKDGKPVMKDVVIQKQYTVPNGGDPEASKATVNELLNNINLFKDRSLYDAKKNPYKGSTDPVNKHKKAATDYGL